MDHFLSCLLQNTSIYYSFAFLNSKYFRRNAILAWIIVSGIFFKSRTLDVPLNKDTHICSLIHYSVHDRHSIVRSIVQYSEISDTLSLCIMTDSC